MVSSWEAMEWAMVNDYKTDYWILVLDSPPEWIPTTQSHICLGDIVKYLGFTLCDWIVTICYVGLVPAKAVE